MQHDARFCGTCGARLDAETEPESAASGTGGVGVGRSSEDCDTPRGQSQLLIAGLAAGVFVTVFAVGTVLTHVLVDALDRALPTGITEGVAALLSIGVVVGAGVALAGVLAAFRVASRGAVLFALCVYGVFAATASLVWWPLSAWAPDLAFGPGAAWIGNGLGAVVIVGPLAVLLVSDHVGCRYPVRAALAAGGVFVVYTAATPLVGSVVAVGGLTDLQVADWVRLVLDVALVVAALTLIISIGELAPAQTADTRLGRGARLTSYAAGAAAITLAVVVAVTAGVTYRIDVAPLATVSKDADLWAEVAGIDAGMEAFVVAVTEFETAYLDYLESGDLPEGCGLGADPDGCGAYVRLSELLAACEAVWPPNLAPGVDSAVAAVLDHLRGLLDVFIDVGSLPRRARVAAAAALADGFGSTMGVWIDAVEEEMPAATCATASFVTDLSGTLGRDLAVLESEEGDMHCGDGWAVLDTAASCTSECGDTHVVVRRVQGRWQLVTALPSSEYCADDLTAEGAPEAIARQTPDCSASPFAQGGSTGSGENGDYEVVERPDKSVELNFSSDVLFEFGSADLTPSAQTTLREIATRLEGASGTVEVEGHTDSISSAEFNQLLSERRAAAVRDYLASAGVTVPMHAVGYGLTMPVAPNANPDGSDNPDGRARNRRVTIIYKP